MWFILKSALLPITLLSAQSISICLLPSSGRKPSICVVTKTSRICILIYCLPGT